MLEDIKPTFLLPLLLVLLVMPAIAYAQDDPCLEELKGSELEAYDSSVGRYLEAVEANDPRAQLSSLDELVGLCDANLRLWVLRGDALAAMGNCAEAKRAYEQVQAEAMGWAYAANAQDAALRAEEGIEALRATCLARVSFRCPQEGTQLEVDGQPHSCPADVDLEEGAHSVRISKDGMQSIERSYTFTTGKNFIELEPLQALAHAGTVSFGCDEAGVEILIGSERYSCPSRQTLEEGLWSFVALRPDGSSYQGQVEIVEGAAISLVIPASGAEGVELGSLVIQCTPVDTTLTIAGQSHACPVALELEPGNYEVVAEASHHESATRHVTIASRERVNLRIELESNRVLGGTGLVFRLMAGAGLALEENGLNSDGSTNYDHRDSLFAFGIEGLLLVPLSTGFYIVPGARYRLSDGYSAVGGVLDLAVGTLDYNLYLGMGMGYGNTGGGCADQSDDGCDAAEEGVTPSARFGLAVSLTDSLGGVFGTELFFGQSFVVDLLAGLEWRI